MLISEEEKKKKEDEAKKIIKSFHENKSFDADNDTLNTNELNFNNKLKEARDIINSINPRQEIPTYTNNINQEVMQSDYDISSNSTLQENE